jgi:hypothetical protein
LLLAAGFLDGLACLSNGQCQLRDVETGLLALIRLMIGMVGALAILYFIWGGVQWLTSYGNQQKIQHGRDIMLQTVIGLIVAFMSFILVEFFVNDFLGAQPDAQVSAVCSNGVKGISCGADGDNYVCTGKDTFQGDNASYNSSCISECQLKSLEDTAANWTCLSQDIADRQGVQSESNLCPGTLKCVQVGSLPIMTDESQECCVLYNSGNPICREISGGSRCNEGEQGYPSSCSTVPQCDPNWQDQAGCCISQDIASDGSEEYFCQDLSAASICEGSLLANTNCSSQPVCN